MDTPTSSEPSALDTNQAASLFAEILEPQATTDHEEPEKKELVTPDEPDEKPDVEPEPEVEDPEAGSEVVTIEVDGKTVELTKAQLADYYKNGLRQADYTKKTMETAEQRKAAEAEASKAREERQQYAQGLQQAQAMLQAQLQEQSQIDWQQLLQNDPVEYLKQQHLAQTRQAKLNQIAQQQQGLAARDKAEQDQALNAFIQTQQQELLAKLPEWKDQAKATTEKTQIKDYLKSQGFDDQALENISDHRAVLMARKAMLYDQMMSKASAVAKKVSSLPQRVERSGGGQAANGMDGRTAAMKQLVRSGKVEDAARVFANLL